MESLCAHDNIEGLDTLFDEYQRQHGKTYPVTKGDIYLALVVSQFKTFEHVIERLAPLDPKVLDTAFQATIETPYLKGFKLLLQHGAQPVGKSVAILLTLLELKEPQRTNRLWIVRTLCALDEVTKSMVLSCMSVVALDDKELIFLMISLGASIHSVSPWFGNESFRWRVLASSTPSFVRKIDTALVMRDPLFTTMFYRCMGRRENRHCGCRRC